MNGSLKPNRIGETSQQYRGHIPQWMSGPLSIGTVCLGLTVGAVDIVLSQPAGTTTPTQGSAGTELLNRPTLKVGSQGTDVTELQAALQLLGFFPGPVNGVYEETTVIAVSRFQQAAGLATDGIVGPATWNRLFPATTPLPAAGNTANRANQPPTNQAKPTPSNRPTTKPGAGVSSAPPTASTSKKPSTSDGNHRTATGTSTSSNTSTTVEPIGLPILRVGMKGPAVVGLQQRLRAIGLFRGAADGIFGAETQAAVKNAQRKFKLDPDGVVGPATWHELMQ